MSTTAIRLPEAKDLNSLDVNPSGELESANHLLNDHDALMRFHDAKGYLLLRQVPSPESVVRAQQAMFAVMVRHGLIAPDATEPVWTGQPFAGGMEESEEFSGISRRLIEHPDNFDLLAKILGGPACLVPIVQYRTYPPGGTVTPVHQDGFFSAGIQNYKPVWMPLTNCEREVGGVMLAVGQNHRGYLHNLAKPPYCPVPEGVIPSDSWATTDDYPGDVLIIHPATPHGSTPNRSNRCRVTMDTRVQSANATRAFRWAPSRRSRPTPSWSTPNTWVSAPFASMPTLSSACSILASALRCRTLPRSLCRACAWWWCLKATTPPPCAKLPKAKAINQRTLVTHKPL